MDMGPKSDSWSSSFLASSRSSHSLAIFSINVHNAHAGTHNFVLTPILSVIAGAVGRPRGNADGTSQLPDAPQPQAQQSNSQGNQSAAADAVTLRNTPMHLLRDQGAIWSSPFRVSGDDLKFLVPVFIATGVALATDTRAMTQVVPINPSLNQHSTDASNVLIGGFIATPVALYWLLGHFKQESACESGGRHPHRRGHG